MSLEVFDFKESAVNTFGTLREDKNFIDVTLVCEDGKQVEVHKVILASSSPFFQSILRKIKHIKHAHPHEGMKSDDLLAIIDFLYCGETSIFRPPAHISTFPELIFLSTFN